MFQLVQHTCVVRKGIKRAVRIPGPQSNQKLPLRIHRLPVSPPGAQCNTPPPQNAADQRCCLYYTPQAVWLCTKSLHLGDSCSNGSSGQHSKRWCHPADSQGCCCWVGWPQAVKQRQHTSEQRESTCLVRCAKGHWYVCQQRGNAQSDLQTQAWKGPAQQQSTLSNACMPGQQPSAMLYGPNLPSATPSTHCECTPWMAMRQGWCCKHTYLSSSQQCADIQRQPGRPRQRQLPRRQPHCRNSSQR